MKYIPIIFGLGIIIVLSILDEAVVLFQQNSFGWLLPFFDGFLDSYFSFPVPYFLGSNWLSIVISLVLFGIIWFFYQKKYDCFFAKLEVSFVPFWLTIASTIAISFLNNQDIALLIILLGYSGQFFVILFGLNKSNYIDGFNNLITSVLLFYSTYWITLLVLCLLMWFIKLIVIVLVIILLFLFISGGNSDDGWDVIILRKR